MIAVLGGLIAVPLIWRYIDWKADVDNPRIDAIKNSLKFPFISSLRGGLLGLFAGLLPAVGTSIGSNLAWKVESKFHPGNDHESVMARLTSAESANNGSQITVLVPLLILGIAIVPSEMILLSVIETKAWIPGQSFWTFYGLGFYSWLMITLIISALICYLVSYVFIKSISRWLENNLRLINRLTILIMSVAVFYAGSLVEARIFFVSCFVLLAMIGVYFKKIDFIPLVAGYFIGDILIDTIIILSFIYG